MFCSVSVKYKPILIKFDTHVQEERLDKTTQKVLTCPKLSANFLGKFEVNAIHFNVSQTRLAVIVSKVVKHVVSYIIFTMHARNVHLQRELRSQMSTNWDDASKRVNSLNQAVRWTCGWRLGASVYVLAFMRDAGILSIWCKNNETYCTFDVVRNDNCQSVCSYSMIH